MAAIPQFLDALKPWAPLIIAVGSLPTLVLVMGMVAEQVGHAFFSGRA